MNENLISRMSIGNSSSSNDHKNYAHTLIPNTEEGVIFDHDQSYNSNTSGDESSKKPHRKLTFLDGIAIVVGIIIGSGIFSSPGLALERSGSPGADLIAWTVSGLLVMLAAHCYLELGGIMPSAGGDFDYLSRAYGTRVGFSFAWFNFFVGKTGSQAIIATVFGRYFESVIMGTTSSLTDGNSDESTTSKLLAAALIITIAVLNCAGIKESAIISIVMTGTKILLVLMVFVFSVIYVCTPGGNHTENFVENLSASSSFNGSKSIFSFGSAMIACLWCFDGYADGNYLQEDMINPRRDLPNIVRIGLVLVTLCYILINIGYFTVLSKDTIIDTKAIAVQFGDTVSDIFKTGKGVLPTILALGVSLSTVGAINGSIMTGGRAFYAVARSGRFPPPLGRLNSRGAPYVALLCQMTWSLVLLMIPGSNFSTLLDYAGPTTWLFYALTASSVIALRYKEPNTQRPFLVPLYPLPPLIVIVIALVIFISSLVESPMFTLLAIGFVVLSVPVYSIMRYYQKKYASGIPSDGHISPPETAVANPLGTFPDDEEFR
jgi:amino acid transporter